MPIPVFLNHGHGWLAVMHLTDRLWLVMVVYCNKCLPNRLKNYKTFRHINLTQTNQYLERPPD
ncbi:hypothetical protein MBO_07453 [Moraxella bovoculi 237]|uniref:Uncharacterized protein n=1 Tax=Moraxella bovoculi 237 TaxID=743974 RepID=A0A066UKU8_9GAMM|nr:hypothetical protein MBO_07453 [Moraxella bovoculi 237]